jgi:vancomycin resistance protein VanJ
VEDYEAMVAGPVTGAEGDAQTGRELPDLRLWPEFGIPAQRAEQTSTPNSPAAGSPFAGPPFAGPPAADSAPSRDARGPQGSGAQPRRDPRPTEQTSGEPAAAATQGPLIPPRPRGALNPPAAVPALPAGAAPQAAQSAAEDAPFPDWTGSDTPAEPAPPSGVAAILGAVPSIENSAAEEGFGVAGPNASGPGGANPNAANPGFPSPTAANPSAATPAAAFPGVANPASPANPADADHTVGENRSVGLPAVADPFIEAFPRQTTAAEVDGAGAGAGGAGDGAGEDGGGQPPEQRQRRAHRRSPMRRQTSTAIAVVACLAVSFLVLHRFLPDAGGIGSLLETWLPWVGVPVAVLLVAALIVHTRRAVIATLAAALVWTALYGPTLLPRGSSAPQQLRVFSEDVNGKAQEATDSGSMALAQHADVVALEDMYSSVSATSAVNALNTAYPNHVTEYEFGLWSRYPITDATPIALGTATSAQSSTLGSDEAGLAAAASDVPVIGALKATLATPHGPLVVYLVHLPQPVLGDQGFAKARDVALTQFVAMLKTDKSARIAVVGDINVAATDRQFSQLTRNDGLASAQQTAGSGFGFTWPAEFPIVRLDDVLTRGLTALRSVVLPAIASGQTHLPIQVDLDY